MTPGAGLVALTEAASHLTEPLCHRRLPGALPSGRRGAPGSSPAPFSPIGCASVMDVVTRGNGVVIGCGEVSANTRVFVERCEAPVEVELECSVGRGARGAAGDCKTQLISFDLVCFQRQAVTVGLSQTRNLPNGLYTMWLYLC